MTSMIRVSRIRRASLTAVIVSVLALGTSATMAASPAMATGDLLTNASGMTLYTFDKDPAGRSACNGACAQNWPPLMAPADAQPSGDYTVVTRDDGTRQWAYKGKALYTWAKDMKPGETTGDGINSVWHVVRP